EEVHPNRPATALIRARIIMDGGDPETALKELDRASAEMARRRSKPATELIFSLEKASPTPPSYLAISETLKTIGDRNGARFWAARGLSRFPGDRQLQAAFRG